MKKIILIHALLSCMNIAYAMSVKGPVIVPPLRLARSEAPCLKHLARTRSCEINKQNIDDGVFKVATKTLSARARKNSSPRGLAGNPGSPQEVRPRTSSLSKDSTESDI